MAFSAQGFKRIGDFGSITDGAANLGLFTYVTADLTATVTTSGYFDSVAEHLAAGAVIIVVSGFGGTEAVNLRVIQAVTSGVVTVT